MADQPAEQSWVDQVRGTEQDLIDVISRDGDLVVEALSNLPPEARGRLQTMIVLAEEVVVQAAHGFQFVIDTGLGTAAWYPDSGSDTAADEDTVVQPDGGGQQPVLSQSWADVTDTPAVGLEVPQPEPAVPQPALALQLTAAPATQEVQPVQQVQTATQVPQTPQPQQVLGPCSKAKSKGQPVPQQQPQPTQQPGGALVPVKAQPKLPQPQTDPQPQVATPSAVPAKPGQPAAKAPTVAAPPDLSQPGQPGTTGVGPVAGRLRQPPPQTRQPVLQRDFQPDQAALAAFPNSLVDYNAGLFFARYESVGDSGLLPDAWPYNAAFAPLCIGREPRLPRSLRNHGHRTSGFCLATCPQCHRRSCSRAVTTSKDGGVAHGHHECPDCHSRAGGRRTR